MPVTYTGKLCAMCNVNAGVVEFGGWCASCQNKGTQQNTHNRWCRFCGGPVPKSISYTKMFVCSANECITELSLEEGFMHLRGRS